MTYDSSYVADMRKSIPAAKTGVRALDRAELATILGGAGSIHAPGPTPPGPPGVI